jgi:Flp pilus assembly pilin Flp
MLRALWKDEAGFVITSELLLIVTIMVIGLIVGMVVVRDAVVQELGDVAAAIGALDQSYQYNGTTSSCVTQGAFTAGGQFTDITDVCDPQPDNSPNGVLITLTPAPEG